MLTWTPKMGVLLKAPGPVSLAQFQQLWEAWPKGDPENTYINLCLLLRQETRTKDKYPVTLDLLVDRWRKYLKQQAQLRTKEQFILSLNTFLVKRKFDVPIAGNTLFNKRFS